MKIRESKKEDKEQIEKLAENNTIHTMGTIVSYNGNYWLVAGTVSDGNRDYHVLLQLSG